MRIFISGIALAVATVLTARVLVGIDSTHDVAVPLVVTGLWVGVALVVTGLALWCRQDIHQRRVDRGLRARR